jgi:hypothetical protein
MLQGGNIPALGTEYNYEIPAEPVPRPRLKKNVTRAPSANPHSESVKLHLNEVKLNQAPGQIYHTVSTFEYPPPQSHWHDVASVVITDLHYGISFYELSLRGRKQFVKVRTNCTCAMYRHHVMTLASYMHHRYPDKRYCSVLHGTKFVFLLIILLLNCGLTTQLI